MWRYRDGRMVGGHGAAATVEQATPFQHSERQHHLRTRGRTLHLCHHVVVVLGEPLSWSQRVAEQHRHHCTTPQSFNQSVHRTFIQAVDPHTANASIDPLTPTVGHSINPHNVLLLIDVYSIQSIGPPGMQSSVWSIYTGFNRSKYSIDRSTFQYSMDWSIFQYSMDWSSVTAFDWRKWSLRKHEVETVHTTFKQWIHTADASIDPHQQSVNQSTQCLLIDLYSIQSIGPPSMQSSVWSICIQDSIDRSIYQYWSSQHLIHGRGPFESMRLELFDSFASSIIHLHFEGFEVLCDIHRAWQWMATQGFQWGPELYQMDRCFFPALSKVCVIILTTY